MTAAQLLDIASAGGEVTEAGCAATSAWASNTSKSWLRGSGAVGINNLMEDAATAEISRSQVWQWLNNDVQLAGGEHVTRDLVERVIARRPRPSGIGSVRTRFAGGRWADATDTFTGLALADEYPSS